MSTVIPQPPEASGVTGIPPIDAALPGEQPQDVPGAPPVPTAP